MSLTLNCQNVNCLLSLLFNQLTDEYYISCQSGSFVGSKDERWENRWNEANYVSRDSKLRLNFKTSLTNMLL